MRQDFVDANAQSPAVEGEWLDKDKRATTERSDKWIYLRYRLQDGRVFTLHADEVAALQESGNKTRWCGLEN